MSNFKNKNVVNYKKLKNSNNKLELIAIDYVGEFSRKKLTYTTHC